MSFYGDAYAALKSVVLIDERLTALASRVDRLSDEVRLMSTRLTRLETIVDIVRPDGAVLRVAPEKPAAKRTPRRLKE